MADSIRIEIDTSASIRMLRAAIDAIEPPSITYAVRDAARVYGAGIDRRAPRKTGRLARSFEIIPLSATSYEVSSDLVYAPVQEFGATIRPRRAQALRFFVGGRLVFARKVTIPAQPYVTPTFEADSGKAFDRFADRVERSIRGEL